MADNSHSLARHCGPAQDLKAANICLQATERGALITLLTCESSNESYVPPILSSPTKNMNMELLNCTRSGTIPYCFPQAGSRLVSSQTASDTLFFTFNQQQKFQSSLFCTVAFPVSVSSKSSIQAGKTSVTFLSSHSSH
jgi:hypothetical protein